MKKITLIVESKDADSTLKELRQSGVLHIEHQNAPVSESVTELEKKRNSLLKAIGALSEATSQKDISCDPEEIVSQILDLCNEREIHRENSSKIKQKIQDWKEWGDFDPEFIDDLKDRNILIQLCKITKKQIQNIPEGVILEELFKKGNLIYCVAISEKEIDLPFETLSLPEQSLKEMFLVQEKEEDGALQINKRLAELSGYQKSLSLYKAKLTSLIEFKRVAAGMGKVERLSYLRGYCPVYNVNLIERLAANQRWGLLIEEPDENDSIPTLIKNPRWIEIIRPVLEMIKTIPGYREMDISAWFLLFFSVFFGMLIGDAGYGAVFFIINLLCHLKFKSSVKNKSIFFLTYVLSSCAIIWGVLTGTFFGQAWLPERVVPLLPYLRENANVQGLCFFIGAFHLSIAHTWRLLRKLPSLKAFSEAGWILVLWTVYFLAKSLILGQAFPAFGKTLFIVGSGLIVFFTNPKKNLFKGIGSGIGDFLLHIVNSFTDVVSYIRLFAVGAATVAVADAFNRMASSVGHSNVFLGFLTAFILLFGHILNILLGAMAILVHGIRLNVLEFSSHLNMEWSGTEYTPFTEEAN
ncbi:MAG: hypothetical protein KJ952_02145 [Candidatus Omnitrophica bacterium]|nr:hypothetical protein [Candidatus Omnitrophota bacterium]